MVTKEKKTIIIQGLIAFLISLILFVSLSFLLVSNTKEVCQRDLCVDGDGDVNLEGIRCNKCYESLLGMDRENSQLALFPLTIFLSVLGMIMFFSLMYIVLVDE